MKIVKKPNQQFEHGVLSVLDFEIVLEKTNLLCLEKTGCLAVLGP